MILAIKKAASHSICAGLGGGAGVGRSAAWRSSSAWLGLSFRVGGGPWPISLFLPVGFPHVFTWALAGGYSSGDRKPNVLCCWNFMSLPFIPPPPSLLVCRLSGEGRQIQCGYFFLSYSITFSFFKTII